MHFRKNFLQYFFLFKFLIDFFQILCGSESIEGEYFGIITDSSNLRYDREMDDENFQGVCKASFLNWKLEKIFSNYAFDIYKKLSKVATSSVDLKKHFFRSLKYQITE